MSAHLRRAEAADIEALKRLLAFGDADHARELPHVFKALDGPRPTEYFEALLADHGVQVIVAEQDETCVGVIVGRLVKSPSIPILQPRQLATIEDLVVHPEYRRRGVGKELLNAAIIWARDQGASEIQLNVYSFNTAAMDLYENMGFCCLSKKMTEAL